MIAALEVGEQSQAKIAETFGVHLSTAEKWWHCWRARQRRVALPHSGGHTRRLEVCEAVIRAAVKRQPDITLAELSDRVEAECAVRASSSMMSRELQRLALRRKKESPRQSAGNAAGDGAARGVW